MSPRIDRIDSRLLAIPYPWPSGWEGREVRRVQIVHTTVFDDHGASGTGFTYCYWGGESVLAMLAHTLHELALGRSLADWEQIWALARECTRRLGTGAVMPALSALDIAVWDLRATSVQQPLYRYLGHHRDAIAAYRTGGDLAGTVADEVVDAALAHAENGYRGVKVKAGRASVTEDVARIRRVREALGDSIAIMVDCNQSLRVPDAITLAHRFGDLGIGWLEEPLDSSDLDGYARLSATSGVPIALGEHLQGRSAFLSYLRHGAAQVIQPDAALTGGVTEWMRVAAMAEDFNVSLAPHSLPDLHVHLALASRGADWVEHYPLIDELLVDPLRPRDGMFVPHERPGHGMQWREDVFSRFQLMHS